MQVDFEPLGSVDAAAEIEQVQMSSTKCVASRPNPSERTPQVKLSIFGRRYSGGRRKYRVSGETPHSYVARNTWKRSTRGGRVLKSVFNSVES